MTTFRAQRTDGQGWVEGNLYTPDKLLSGVWISPTCDYCDFYPGFEDGDNLEDFKDKGIVIGRFHQVDPSTLQIKTTKGEFKPINEVEIL